MSSRSVFIGSAILLTALCAAEAQVPSFASSPFGAGTTPYSVAVGDFNGDGKPDFAVANSGGNNVTVLLGNGAGGFAAATGSPFAAGTTPYSVAVGDFNGDGNPDLVVANSGGNNVTLLLGNGAGSFTAATSSPFAAGTTPYSVAVGDFNGDGNPDLAVANSGGNNVTVLLGNGAGGFTAATGSPFAAGTTPYSVAVGDFNRDGKQDLAIANSGGNNVTVLLGNGTGGFTAAGSSPFAAGANPRSVVVGDFDGDGRQDLAIANYSGNNVTVLLGSGTGGFTAAGSSPFAAGMNPQSVVVGDFNGDGNKDLAIANSGGNNVTVLLGSGAGGFTAATGSPFATGASPWSVAAGDFNADGEPDLAIANSGGNGVTLLLNTSPLLTANPASVVFYAGAGQAAPPGIPVNVTSSQAGFTYAAGSDQTWLTPSPASNATGGNSIITLSANQSALTAGSYAGNVRFTSPDFFVTKTAATLQVANPSGTFTAASGSPFFSRPYALAAGDFNGDGNPDLAVTNFGGSGSHTVTVLLGNGLGGFTQATGSPISTGTNSQPISVAVGDFNLDGKLDLAVANNNNNNVTVLLGNGAGGFTATAGSPISTGINSQPYSVAVADFNGDGKPDLAIVNVNGNSVTVLLGNGAGGFAAPPGSPFAVGQEPGSVAVGDFNGDGKADLVTTNFNENNVTLLLGNGAGGFTAAAGSPFAVGTGPDFVAVGDFNGDGALDLAVANKSGNNVTVLLGNGTGGFRAGPGSPFTAGTQPNSIAVGDFNGDGAPDLAIANPSSNNVTLLLGSGAGGFTPAATSPLTAASAESVAVADFNRDGKPDLAIVRATAGQVTVLLGASATTNSSLSTTAGATAGYGSSVPLTLSVSQTGFNAPTGTATFYDGATALGTANQTTSPFTLATSTLAPGSHTLTAVYSGDTRNLTSTSNGVTILVTQGSQTITFGALSNQVLGTAPFTVSATASSGLAVGFDSSTTTLVCTVAGSLVTLVAVGTCTITASQTGNASYQAALAVTRSFNVSNPNVITFPQPVDSALSAGPVILTATASSGLAVSYGSNSTGVCTVSGSSVTLLTVGTCSITANQAGNGTFAAATAVTKAFNVTLNPNVITLPQPVDTVLSAGPVTLTATASSGLAVTYISNSNAVCTVSGSLVTLIAPGTCSITAVQVGNANYAAAVGVTRTFAVSLVVQNPTVTLAVGNGAGFAGNVVEIPIQVTSVGTPALVTLQLDLSFNPQELTFQSARVGAQSTAAGKSLTISPQPNGNIRLLAAGLTQNVIANGIVAYATFNLATPFSATAVTPVGCTSGDVLSNALGTVCTAGTIHFPACDINGDGVVNVSDVQLIINQALGVTPAVSDLNKDGSVNVSDVQIAINAALGLGCSVAP